jgi:dihydroorotate dehydrogenase
MILDAAASILRLFPAENAHRATIWLTEALGGLLPAGSSSDPRLAIRVLGRNFANPIGLAAGFDKDGRVPDAMLKMGFGFVECGTVTPKPQAGNPQPRLFRLAEDRAVINRMGFNNDGMEAAAARLVSARRRGIVGINIGANKDATDRIADYRAAFARLALVADYVAVNVSSPNTPGLRGLQNRDELERLLSTLTQIRSRLGLSVPLLLKIAPDLDAHALDDIAEVAVKSGIEGLIVSNSTIARPQTLKSRHATEAGGLSGAPLFEPSTKILHETFARTGTKLVLIGVGGVTSGADAYAKIRAGASLVQLYSALAYRGPGIIAHIQRELVDCLSRDGFAHVGDAVGAAHTK